MANHIAVIWTLMWFFCAYYRSASSECDKDTPRSCKKLYWCHPFLFGLSERVHRWIYETTSFSEWQLFEYERRNRLSPSDRITTFHTVGCQTRTMGKWLNIRIDKPHIHSEYMTSIGAAQEQKRNVYTSTGHTNRKRNGESNWHLNGEIQ